MAALPQAEAESPAPGQDPPPQLLERPDAVARTVRRDPSARTFVSPLARRLLREAQMSSDGVTGSGPHGRIVRRDVELLVGGQGRQVTNDEQHPPAPEPAGAGQAGVPHFYVKRTVVVDQLLALLQDLNEHAPARISVTDCLVRAVAVAHVQVPIVNAIWTTGAPRVLDGVDIAVSVPSRHGAATAVLRGAEKLNLSTISSSVRALVSKASEGRLGEEDVNGGAITVMDLTEFGIDQFFAIVDPPRSSVLTAGALTPTARVVDGVVTPAIGLDLVLSVDRRVIGRTSAAEWMTALVAAVENPLRLVV